MDREYAKKVEESQKKAYGVPHNIFDVSSYGEVNMKNIYATSPQNIDNPKGYCKEEKQTYDQSVSLVQMQDSMNFDDFKRKASA